MLPHNLKDIMKMILCSIFFAALGSSLSAQTQEISPTMSSNTTKLASTIFDWEKMQPTTTSNGVQRALFDAPTTTLDKIHCHITTLNPGQNSGAPSRHLQEELIIIKEGVVEATVDGRTQTIGPGSVIFFAANAVTRLRNAGTGPATYTVIYYYTPLTPKE
jgi:mannose-6-phosphate isomerase-like protein (cupin superfamily)